MRRREFIARLAGSAVAWPVVARAQPFPVVGFLHSQAPDLYGNVLAGFHRGLNDAGYEEDRNIAIDYRWASDKIERLPELAADLVRRQVSVIVVGGGTPATRAAKAATSSIPIVFVTGSDPVALGLVASLNRPGGNITGVTFITSILASKRLDLLSKLVPQATTIGYLSDPRFFNGQRRD
jgi:putative tryptophan/tyrosine transport system substrate-binding protein